MAANPVVPTPELQVNTEKKPEETIVHASGRITSATSDLLQRTIRGLIPGTKRIVLDLAGGQLHRQFWPRCAGQRLSGREQSPVCSGAGESAGTD
jgi:hypothetical protein